MSPVNSSKSFLFILNYNGFCISLLVFFQSTLIHVFFHQLLQAVYSHVLFFFIFYLFIIVTFICKYPSISHEVAWHNSKFIFTITWFSIGCLVCINEWIYKLMKVIHFIIFRTKWHFFIFIEVSIKFVKSVLRVIIITTVIFSSVTNFISSNKCI